jgi:hypothetical protein
MTESRPSTWTLARFFITLGVVSAAMAAWVVVVRLLGMTYAEVSSPALYIGNLIAWTIAVPTLVMWAIWEYKKRRQLERQLQALQQQRHQWQ